MNATNNFHHLKSIALTLLLWLTGLAAFSQNYIFNTEILNLKDGLPHRMVYAVVQDKEGFIWVNTQGAISRYDGYRFKTYNASFLNIAESNAVTLAVDAENRLWYWEKDLNAPNSGVIDTSKDSIYSMETISNGLFTSREVLYIGNAMPGSDDILIATRYGIIYKYDGDFEELYRFPKPFEIHPICRANPDGSYWIAHTTKAFNIKDGKVLKIIDVGYEKNIINIITSYPDLVLETDYPFPGYLKLENDAFVPFSIASHAPEEIKWLLQLHRDYTCYAIENTLLIRDSNGKLIYSSDALELAAYDTRLNANAMFLDRQNILWIATQNGLIKLMAKKNLFNTMFPGSSARAIFNDGEQLWMGGVQSDTVPDHIKTEQEYTDPDRYDAMSFCKDLSGHLWIGTQSSKIVEYISGQDTYIHYDFELAGHAFHQIFQNPVTRNYWIGTNNGLFRFDPANKKITPSPLPIASEGLIIRQFHQNTQGIWLASNNGLFLMDTEKEVILKHYTIANGLPADNIHHIHEDKDGIFWLGTKDAGLVRWDTASNSFRQYSRENELSNNKIYAVYEDEDETLWLPSDYGLMAFDKNTETTRVYLPKDGIAHEEFNYFSHFQDKDGTLYFGGLNGITKFHPEALRAETSTKLPLYTTRVRVLEKDEETFTNKTDAYHSAQKIVLSPADRILELELTLLDYERSGQNQYAYKLSGKQEQWIYTRENKLSIINPPYGKYNLVIKARGTSGAWSKEPLIIPMQVQPPFYMQWWFILASVLVTITMIIIAVRWRIRKLEKDRSRLESEVQRRTRQIETDKKIIEKDKQIIEQQARDLQALDKAKTRFFANITHEFRTPLTLVTGPLEQMVEKLPSPETVRSNISGVLKNARNLMTLINQLLDLSKLEGGQMKTLLSHGDIIAYTKALTHSFQPLADTKQIALEFQANAVHWQTHFDSDKWTKIVYNLLSNAIKFTPEGGRVVVKLQREKQGKEVQIQLKVEDTGIGIAPENLKHIFNRFYQADASTTRLQGGTGIGLSLVKELATLQNGTVTVNSTLGKGTEFTVLLPVVQTQAGERIRPVSVPENILLSPADEEIPVKNKQTATNGTDQKEKQEKLELLIIEDNNEMRSYIRSCIDETTYRITEAADGEKGIEMARQIIPDLIISDVMMPGKNGFEVTRIIREHIATSHIPLILLTAKASLESRLEGLKRGADAYLTKPFSPQELVLRIKKLIELRQMLQQRYQNRETPPAENPVFEKEDGFIKELKNYILEHMSEPGLSVDHIARYFAMSRMQLHRKLKALINTPIGHYIRSVKMEKALEFLKEKQLNITEIAYETGFSPSNFSKVFKKVYGKTPSEF